MNSDVYERMHKRLLKLYGDDQAHDLSVRLGGLVERYLKKSQRGPTELWTEKDAVLITYGDMIQDGEEKSLQVLKRFCDERLYGAINTIHILPFNPASSDGGFSVIDYREIDPALGEWTEIESLRNSYYLMFDLVLNHCSASSEWFQNYLKGEGVGKDYFIESDPDADLSQVTRPRPWPLLTPFETREGEKHVWTTFSNDQVDLDFSNPQVLFEFLEILLMYVDKGARLVRLDAVAFIWKEIGTTCIHHELTHEIIKIFRDVLELVAPHVIIITETNVPHVENISYFGQGDEAHMVYNFALPPLLLHGLLRHDSSVLQGWARGLEDVPEQCTYLNFTASHDGIGVRPIQDLVPKDEIDWMVDQVRERKGEVNMRSLPDGSQSPYELNITYRDALSDPDDERLGMRRFLCSQAIALAFKGIPALYFHSLMGEHTWQEGMEEGENRDGNRRRWQWDELDAAISSAGTGHAYVFGMYSEMLRVRRSVWAFHPDASQTIIETKSEVFAFIRQGENTPAVLCWFNFTGQKTYIQKDWLETHLGQGRYLNLLTGNFLEFVNGATDAGRYSALWLTLS